MYSVPLNLFCDPAMPLLIATSLRAFPSDADRTKYPAVSLPTPMKNVTIHTDGGCDVNPGPGGWAAVLSYGGRTREIGGGESATTNNRMELLAAIHALEALKEPCVVEVFTDSTYLRDGITKWIAGWKRKGWRTAQKQPVRNEDLWRRLEASAAPHRVTWQWLRGHVGHVLNEQCDRRAQAEIARIKRTTPAVELQSALAAFSAAREAAASAAAQPSLLPGVYP